MSLMSISLRPFRRLPAARGRNLVTAALVGLACSSVALSTASANSPRPQAAAQLDAAGEQAREHFIAALRLAQQGRVDEAIVEAEEGSRLGPADADGLNLLGQLYAQVERDPDAESAFQRAMRADPEWAEPFRNLGRLYMRQQKFSAAVAPLIHAAGIDDSDPLLQGQLGIAFRESGRPEQSLAAFERAWQMVPDDSQLALDVALARRANRDTEGAIRAVERAVELDSSNPLPHMILAQLYVNSDRVDYLVKAPALYRHVLELEPERSDVWLALARAYTQIAIRDEAEIALRRAMDLGLDNPDVRFRLGQTLGRQQQFAAAEAEYDRVLAAIPDHGMALYLRGEARFNLNRFDEALEDFHAAVAAMPGSPDPILAAVTIYMVQGDLEAAENNLIMARSTNQAREQVELAIGRLRVRQGRNEEALLALDETLRIDPSLIEAEYLRGQAQLKLGRVEQGRETLAEYQRKLNEQRSAEVEQLRVGVVGGAQIYVLRGQVFLNEGRLDEALEQLLSASERAPGSRRVWSALALIYDARGEGEEAAAARTRAAQLPEGTD